MREIIDISRFKRNSDFYGDLSLLVSIKSFDLQAVRKRYIASRASGKKRVGSVKRRQKSEGGVAKLKIGKGKVENEQILCKMLEPRALDWDEHRLIVGSDRIIWIFDGHEVITLRHKWFSYIHTATFSPFKSDCILIACSGYDMILEINYKSTAVEFEWLSWENGFNQAYDAEADSFITLTRNKTEFEKLTKESQAAILIENPENDSLPTAKRAAFINTVSYHPEKKDRIFATLFHKGAMLEINTNDGSSRTIIDGMKSPHGSRKEDGIYYATSTASGEFIVKESEKTLVYDFSSLPEKAEGMEGLEWLQNTIKMGNFFITIDSNRNSFVIFDPKLEMYDMIPYNLNWTIQDLVSAPKSDNAIINQLSSFNFEEHG